VQCNGGTLGGSPALDGGTLVNAGNLIDSVSFALTTQHSSVISNLAGATLLFAADSGTYFGGSGGRGTIYNYGLVSKNGSSGTAGIADTFYNFGTVEAAAGTLAFSSAYVQSAGGTELDGGSISISGSSFEIQGGGLSGSNTVTGSVDVGTAGTVNPGAPIGSLQVTGNYTNAGSLNIALGGTTPGTGFDVLTVGGAARIAGGTLNVSLTNGFMPSASMSFVFLNAAPVLGTFSTFNYPNNLGGLRMKLTYTSTSVTIGFSPLPYVNAGPTNQAVPSGGTVNLSVSAGGTGPFGYQWLKDGRLLPGATAGTLTISDAGVTQSGAYSVVITNGYGMAISLPALVTVGEPDLFGWGDNVWGQLGDGTGNSWPQPQVVRCGVLSVADGQGFSLFLRGDGTLWAAGENAYGQLGDGTLLTRSNAVPVIGGTNVVAVAAGYLYALFLKSDGTLWGMGGDFWNDFPSGPGGRVSNAIPVTSISNVAAMAIGSLHELFLKTDGTLWAMGANASGQLGNGTGVTPAGPTAVPGGTNVVAIAAGMDYSLFLKMDGTVWAMGANDHGQLGDSTLVNRSNAVAVIGGTNVAAIAAGAYHSLFLKADGTLWAVGDDTLGELGDNNTANGVTIRSNAVAVIGGANVVAMAAGNYDSWFVKADGTLWGMGDDEESSLGDGGIYGWELVPVALTNVAVANIVSFCGSYNAFATGLRVAGASLPIVLSSMAWTPSGGANINFTNTPGLSFSIVTATNVALPANEWTWLGVVNETSPGQFQFTDPLVTNTPQRFYRARCP
jgi:alpha-tubulin suppressor-like RCC1 family protein